LEGAAAGASGRAAGLIAGMMVVKSRSSAPEEEDALAAGAFAPGFTAATAARDCELDAARAATSRTKPSLSSCAMSFSNSASKLLPTFCATSPSVARPSIAESTARSARLSRLVLPEASWTPLPDFE
jgi:hypothetical protein